MEAHPEHRPAAPVPPPAPAGGTSGPLFALNSVLSSIESVRNARALYLLLLAFSAGGLAMSQAQVAFGREALPQGAAWLLAAFLLLFYSTNAAGLVLMDEARGREPRLPAEALRDALRCAHRLLAVVLVVLLGAALLAAAVTALLALGRVPGLGPTLLAVALVPAVPVLGLAGLTLLALVGPVGAPAVWDGLAVRAVLALLWRQLRVRLAHALMLSAAVSLLAATVTGLVSAVLLAGGRAALAITAWGLQIDLAPGPVLAALFGQGWRAPPGAPALSEHTRAALDGAGVVFALGLVVPGVVYLRGLCELYLALRRSDEAAAAPAAPAPAAPPTA